MCGKKKCIQSLKYQTLIMNLLLYSGVSLGKII